MKKIFIFASLFVLMGFFGLHAQTQITIEQSDMPSPGDRPRTSTADTLIVVDPGPTGANFNWDFSGLMPQFQQVDSFISRSDLPFTLLFSVSSKANLVQYIRTSADSLPIGGVSFSGGYQINEKNASAYNDMGQATLLNGLLPIFLEKDPVDVVYRFPLNYLDTDSGFSQAILDLQIPGLGSFYIRQDRTRKSEVDGWGSITTPFGTFDAIRVRSEIMGEDSIKFDTLINFKVPTIPRVEYKWLAKGMDIPILQINTTALGGNEVVTQVIYQDSLRGEVPTLGLESKLAPLEAQLFPNPTTDQLHIRIPELRGQTAQIRLFDLQGRMILQRQSRENVFEIDMNYLVPAYYVLEITTEDRYFIERIIKK